MHCLSFDDPGQWWRYVAGANWYHPLGPSSAVTIRPNDPVVQVCYEDAFAYAKWAGKRLPTEAEWEYAARAGKESKDYYWGEELKPAGKWMANIFQGKFPNKNSLEDGFDFLAPVKSFPPNAFGLYDMEGMFGNGAVITTDLIIIKPATKIIHKDLLAVLILMNLMLLRELFAVVPFCAVTNIAFVTEQAVGGKGK